MDDEKIILEFDQQEMRSCSSRVVSNASKCHEFSQSGSRGLGLRQNS